jgi:hypothetical protein
MGMLDHQAPGCFLSSASDTVDSRGSDKPARRTSSFDSSRHKSYISYMSATATLSIRVPQQTRRWLERFAKRRGSAGMAASRILEEAWRREDFPAVEFRDTPLGRVAYAQGTRVQVAFVYGQMLNEPELTPQNLAESFAWPLWKARGVLAYMAEFGDECRLEWEDLESVGLPVLRRSLPQTEHCEIDVA